MAMSSSRIFIALCGATFVAIPSLWLLLFILLHSSLALLGTEANASSSDGAATGGHLG